MTVELVTFTMCLYFQTLFSRTLHTSHGKQVGVVILNLAIYILKTVVASMNLEYIFDIPMKSQKTNNM